MIEASREVQKARLRRREWLLQQTLKPRSPMTAPQQSGHQDHSQDETDQKNDDHSLCIYLAHVHPFSPSAGFSQSVAVVAVLVVTRGIDPSQDLSQRYGKERGQSANDFSKNRKQARMLPHL